MSNTAASRKGVRDAGRFGSRAFINCFSATKALKPKHPAPLTPFLEAAVFLIQSFLKILFRSIGCANESQ